MTQVIVGTFVAIFLGALFFWIIPEEILKPKIVKDAEKKMLSEDDKEREISRKTESVDDFFGGTAKLLIGIVLFFMFAPILFPLMFR